MSVADEVDVSIMGGGLAGLSLGLQLRRSMPALRVAVLERQRHPAPEAAFKVGESSVELGAHYFAEVLGLREHLREQQLPKLGLRFFFPAGDNSAIDRRLEIGARDFPPTPSFQIDRGRFENHLAERCREEGVEWVDDAKVTSVQLGEGGGRHQISFEQGGRTGTLSARWLVDATGRRSMLKRALGLARTNDHHVSAAWFRIGDRVDIDEWSRRPEWTRDHRGRTSRWFSTNHLVGRGYWVWLIPLASGSTSIGIVADPRLHPKAGFGTFPKALEWLAKHEPQCAAAVEQRRDAVQDFLTLERLSFDCARVYSQERWCLVGDAGAFLDPFYSPGSDFISITNTFVTDLVARDRAGEDLRERVEAYNATYLALHRNTLAVFSGQYPMFGAPHAMPAKLLWDFAAYWSMLCFAGIQGRLTDLAMNAGLRDGLTAVGTLNAQMQRLFGRWGAVDREGSHGGFANLLDIPYMEELCRTVSQPVAKDGFPAVFRARLSMLPRLAGEIFHRAYALHPELRESEGLALAAGRSDLLGGFFDWIGAQPEGPAPAAQAPRAGVDAR